MRIPNARGLHALALRAAFLAAVAAVGGLKSSKIKVSAALRSRHDAGEDGTIVVDYGIIVTINYISTSLD